MTAAAPAPKMSAANNVHLAMENATDAVASGRSSPMAFVQSFGGKMKLMANRA